MAGPILRASLLLPQIARPRTITREQIVEGLWLIGWGFFQKMFVADNLAHARRRTCSNRRRRRPGSTCWSAIYAFAFQIYGDFAGYSNIARGTVEADGHRAHRQLPVSRTSSSSPQAFWRNWHISLSTWLRDYLYIPLGGNRGRTWQTTRNLLITMVLGGLWHGAAWTFVLWGAYQGVRARDRRSDRAPGRDRLGIAVPPGLNGGGCALGVVMFHVTCYGWLIFRAESIGQIARFTRLLVTDLLPSANTVPSLVVPARRRSCRCSPCTSSRRVAARNRPCWGCGGPSDTPCMSRSSTSCWCSETSRAPSSSTSSSEVV